MQERYERRFWMCATNYFIILFVGVIGVEV